MLAAAVSVFALLATGRSGRKKALLSWLGRWLWILSAGLVNRGYGYYRPYFRPAYDYPARYRRAYYRPAPVFVFGFGFR